MTGSKLVQLNEQVGRLLKARSTAVIIVESCIDGWIAKVIIDITGGSVWFERGSVIYSNEAEAQMIDVCKETLTQHGAVSESVVVEVAMGVLKAVHADHTVPISGIAGPGGGNEEEPVGAAWFAFVTVRGEGIIRRECLSGDRDAVRRQATAYTSQTLRQQFI